MVQLINIKQNKFYGLCYEALMQV